MILAVVCESGEAVAQDEIEAEIARRYSLRTGQRPAAVHCPSGVPNRLGAEVECEVETGLAIELSVIVTVTELRDDAISYEITWR